MSRRASSKPADGALRRRADNVQTIELQRDCKTMHREHSKRRQIWPIELRGALQRYASRAGRGPLRPLGDAS